MTVAPASFNALPADECRALLRDCLAVDWWAARLCAQRPYQSVAELLAAARAAGSRRLDAADVAAALSRHPRIGERAPGAGQHASWSRSEQSGVEGGADLAARVAAGNAAYEQRFGRIFLVRAAGRSGADILRLLEDRLANTADDELGIVASELVDIAVLRLTAAVAG